MPKCVFETKGERDNKGVFLWAKKKVGQANFWDERQLLTSKHTCSDQVAEAQTLKLLSPDFLLC